jgi:hypothetical protein
MECGRKGKLPLRTTPRGRRRDPLVDLLPELRRRGDISAITGVFENRLTRD